MPTTLDNHLYQHRPFGFLTLLIMLLSVQILPAVVAVDNRVDFLLFGYTLVLFSSLYLVVYERKELIIGFVLTLPMLFANWKLSTDSVNLQVAINSVFYIVFLLYVSVFILRYLFESYDVSFDMICAAVCLYFIAGMIWSFIYLLVELLNPGSFNLVETASGYREKLTDLSYFSFVTLATLGYGDISPITRAGRSWAILEAIFGQFYLACVVARLVALHLTTRTTNKS
ncbi:potassium channel family protein [Oceanicoccus sagamiensis]|uniref:Potassium channel domain-containing protein n=1 Tax=Oceanicoccus sagamiensis TaxID=716816 RepID=A0A1X9NF09_9GAMM|nr:potassium channel family protein [Oceanicoccus sagamiensis]ARN75751.1 hypothetical protein BST96_17540 [Oceanicoccus sagamiensis]